MNLLAKPASIFFFVLSLTQVNAQHTPKLAKDSVQAVVAAMTLAEKCKLVVGMGFKLPGMPPPSKDNPQGGLPGVSLPASDPEGDSLPDKVPGAAGRTHPILRLGIPSISVTDGPAGIRIQQPATAFPVATLLASSWDTALVRAVGVAFGNEVLEYGSDVLLGPGMNIHRNPLGGRNFEYYSEDPLLAGSMAGAIVTGMQSNGIGTSIKHFVANNQETDRMSVNTIVSQRALREIYLKGFEIAVRRSDPWTVMSSYNLLNGTYTSQRRDLLTTILRDEWGFRGLVMSDWFGGDDPVAQIRAGNDLIMPGSPDKSEKIAEAVKRGDLSVNDLDRSVTRVLELILRSAEFRKYKFSSKPDLVAHARIVRQAAAEGMILLKNDANTLPITPGKIALFGNYGYDLIAGGTGSGDVKKPYTVTLAEGLTKGGYHIDQSIQKIYTRYIAEAKAAQPAGPLTILNPPPPPAEMNLTSDYIRQEAQQADVAVFVIGRNAGEGRDRKLDSDYYLTDAEKRLIRTISDAFHAQKKRLVVVLNIGGVIEVASWRQQADAILLAWQPGLEGGNSIADIISGKINPSGHLATSFPMDYKDVASSGTFPGKEFKDKATKGFFGMPMVPAEVTYDEGIYVGYRYYHTRGIPTAYEFGYGLSYTSFDFTNLKVGTPSIEGTVDISIDIMNKGKVSGKEVGQIYISAPSGADHMDKPSEELKAFAKTNLLAPGATETLHFVLAAADLASFDTPSSSWVADGGEYIVHAGASSEDLRQTGHFSLGANIIVQKVHAVLALPTP